MSLRSQTISGIGWSSFARLIKQGGQFTLSILLMRLLSVEDYGLIGMAMVFIGFANIFKEFGFGSAIVQRSQLAESHYSSTFYVNILAGALLCALFIFISPYLAIFYNNSNLTIIVQVLAFDFLIAGFGIVPRAIMLRNMRFDLLSKIGIISAIIPGLIAVGVAYAGFGVWALVFQTLLQTIISVLSYFVATTWKPTWQFSSRAVGQLWAYSANLTGYNTINYWARSADDLLIGKFMGSSALGIYTRAYSLMLLPIKQIISVISQVMFSALSKIQREKDRVKRVYLKTMQVLAFISFPIMIGLFIVAEPFVLALFGQKWAGIVPLIQILTWVGITQTLCNPTGWIYQSQGKTNWLFYWGLCGSGSLIIAIVIGVWWGSVESVAISYAIMNILITYPCIAIPGKLINMSFAEVIKIVLPSFLIAVVMGILVYLMNFFFLKDIGVNLQLLTEVLWGIITYIGLAKLFGLDALKELQKIVLSYTRETYN